MAKYEDYTYKAKNILRRMSHRRRFKKSFSYLPTDDKHSRILDFGCGDGFFLDLIHTQCPEMENCFGYEPYLDTIPNDYKIYREWEEIENEKQQNGPFDLVFCLEVLEHLSAPKQKEILERIYSILSDRGKVIISVPIEKNFPVLIKSFFRRVEGGRFTEQYTLQNTIDSFRGKPLPQFRNGDGYLDHIGFYYDDLEKNFSPLFSIIKKEYSPLPIGKGHLNSQVFYQLVKVS